MSTPLYPSLDVIRAELDKRRQEQSQKAASFDTRAGLVLGFGGVLIGLAPAQTTALHLSGQVAAALAAAVAGWSLTFRVTGSVGPRALRDNYLTKAPEETQLRLLDTRSWLFELDEKRFEAKVERMKWAVWLLALAVALMLAGSIVAYTRAGGWR